MRGIFGGPSFLSPRRRLESADPAEPRGGFVGFSAIDGSCLAKADGRALLCENASHSISRPAKGGPDSRGGRWRAAGLRAKFRFPVSPAQAATTVRAASLRGLTASFGPACLHTLARGGDMF